MKSKIFVVLAMVIVVGGFCLICNMATELRAQRAENNKLRTEAVALQLKADNLEIIMWQEWVPQTFWDVQNLEAVNYETLSPIYFHTTQKHPTSWVFEK